MDKREAPATTRKNFDVLVVGAGPAGLSAAVSAAAMGAKVGIVDDNARIGGQIWRAGISDAAHHPLKWPRQAPQWAGRLQTAGVAVLSSTQVVHCDIQRRVLFAESRTTFFEIGFSKLILATGARERLLPFPGWTIPNVMAAGGLQAMVKSGLPIAGTRVIVAGTGPLLLAVAAYLRKKNAKVLAVCEQAPWRALVGFALGLLSEPRKIREAISLQAQIAAIPFWPNTWPLKAAGRDRLERVLISRNGNRRELACDYLACGFHLVANTELASALGCALQGDRVQVDERQQTSVDDVYCAGEATGIGGVAASLIEGEIAGLAAAGFGDRTHHLRGGLRKAQSFARRLERAFTLRPELKSLAHSDTIVCRCEDVTYSRASQYRSWRDAKNQTRCGMGPCQGRICGPATQFLFEWRPASFRPPIFPARIASLAALASANLAGEGQKIGDDQ